MPSYIIKVNPEDDAYVYWSTATDSPHFYGTRAEVGVYLREIGEATDLDGRFGRADTTGTSMRERIDRHGNVSPGLYAFGVEEFIVERRGVAARCDLLELARAYGAGEPYMQLLKPLQQ